MELWAVRVGILDKGAAWNCRPCVEGTLCDSLGHLSLALAPCLCSGTDMRPHDHSSGILRALHVGYCLYWIASNGASWRYSLGWIGSKLAEACGLCNAGQVRPTPADFFQDLSKNLHVFVVIFWSQTTDGRRRLCEPRRQCSRKAYLCPRRWSCVPTDPMCDLCSSSVCILACTTRTFGLIETWPP